MRRCHNTDSETGKLCDLRKHCLLHKLMTVHELPWQQYFKVFKGLLKLGTLTEGKNKNKPTKQKTPKPTNLLEKSTPLWASLLRGGASAAGLPKARDSRFSKSRQQGTMNWKYPQQPTKHAIDQLGILFWRKQGCISRGRASSNVSAKPRGVHRMF